ncbi:bacterial regulatory helix-turn-helix, lysR family protein [Burkholderia thailandensis 34]|nr:bacterial regulatory helix-turn-helix, lysR family protein [Burkholderia thailandensis 34]MDD1483837.1 transcriptional regulator CynR [Burkholderia thailandensis]MDD1490037.1 transcriptional regulator CynR [Burkholderia thailandensis]MDD1495964.1 transcriptional regulator CynR [Burkholderia thailandensis]PNE77411.1 transcriptional regulator CynR [Burkholderia thailandensis]
MESDMMAARSATFYDHLCDDAATGVSDRSAAGAPADARRASDMPGDAAADGRRPPRTIPRSATAREAQDVAPPERHAQRLIRRNMKSMQRNPLLRNICYLLAVDEHRNFTRAAEALSISQSALSQKIRQLEDELGAQLFDRSGRVVQLTDFGGVYLEYARRAHSDLLTAQRALNDVHDLSRGQLRIGFTPTFTEYLIAPVIEHFHERYPGIVIEMTEMSLDAVETALGDDQVDLAFGFVDVRSDEIEAEALFPERLMLVAGDTHPLTAQRDPITPDQLAETPLALLTTSFVSRFYIDSYFQSYDMKPNVALQANSISAVLKIVRRGKIATILPGTIEFEHRDLQYVPLDPPFPVRTVALLRRKGAYRTVASTAFAESVRALLDNGSLSSLRTMTKRDDS